MTLESCSSDCAGYAYFGVEYGRECGHSPLIFASDTDIFPQVIVETASQLGRWLLRLVNVLLRVLEIQQSFAGLEIVSRCTRKVLQAEQPRLEAGVEEQRRRPLLWEPLNQPGLVLRKLACLLAGCILDVCSE